MLTRRRSSSSGSWSEMSLSSFSPDDSAHLCLADAELTGQFALEDSSSAVSGTQITHLGIREFRGIVLLSAYGPLRVLRQIVVGPLGGAVTAFVDFVRHVVLRRPQKPVGLVLARRVVTAVA